MTLETLTAKRYQEFHSIGYRTLDIRCVLNINDAKFRAWRTEQGLSI